MQLVRDVFHAERVTDAIAPCMAFDTAWFCVVIQTLNPLAHKLQAESFPFYYGVIHFSNASHPLSVSRSNMFPDRESLFSGIYQITIWLLLL